MVRRVPGGPSALERLVRSCLAASAVGLLGAPVAAEYVGAGAFAYVVPAVLGVLCGAAAVAAGGAPGRAGSARAVAVAYAVLGVGLGFVLEGSRGPLSVAALPPYAVAAAGALLWTQPAPVRTARSD